jgi:hypothetical protein
VACVTHTKSNHQLDLSIDFRDRNVNFLDSNLYTGVELDEVCDFGVQVDVGFQVLDRQFDATDMEFGHVEVDIWWCAGRRCAGS